MPSTLATLLNSRLSRYAIAVGAFAATPMQGAPITVLLPTPINLALAPGEFYTFDVDQNGGANFALSRVGTGPGTSMGYAFPNNWSANFGVSGTNAQQLGEGFLIGLSATGSFWATSALLRYDTSPSPTFLALRFASTSGSANRVGFAQFSGPTLYGFAWDQASTITTFDITAPPTGVPEPATGALTALALGAVAFAARKRKRKQA